MLQKTKVHEAEMLHLAIKYESVFFPFHFNQRVYVNSAGNSYISTNNTLAWRDSFLCYDPYSLIISGINWQCHVAKWIALPRVPSSRLEPFIVILFPWQPDRDHGINRDTKAFYICCGSHANMGVAGTNRSAPVDVGAVVSRCCDVWWWRA